MHTDCELLRSKTNAMYQQWKKARELNQLSLRDGRETNDGRPVSPCLNLENSTVNDAFSSTMFQDNGGIISGHYRELQARLLRQKLASLNNITVITESQDSEGENTEQEEPEVTPHKRNSACDLSDRMDIATGVMSTTERNHERRKSEGSLRLYERQLESHDLTKVVRTHGIISDEHPTNCTNKCLQFLHSNSASRVQNDQLNSPQRLRRASVECLLSSSSNSEITSRLRTRVGVFSREKPVISGDVLQLLGERSRERNDDNYDLSTDILSRERRRSWQCYDKNWNNLVAKAKNYQTPLDNKQFMETSFNESANLESDVESSEISETSSIISSLSSSSRHSSDSGTQDETLLMVKRHSSAVHAQTSNIFTIDEDGSKSLNMSLGEGDLDLRQETRLGSGDHAKQPTRRYSVATSSPKIFTRQKISGYSTHGALEYAKELLGKLQDEGKTKSKKERLDELSKALKWILEELNRIEFPDRELVTLMTSLRAQIFNLRAELKMEECEESGQKLGIPLSDKASFSRSRRFSWC